METALDEQRTRLTISGEISSECAELVESCCQQAIRDGKAVELVLDVTNIDESGPRTPAESRGERCLPGCEGCLLFVRCRHDPPSRES